jgi:restriction endonuclease Mrr
VPATAPIFPVLPDAEFEQRVISLLHAFQYRSIQPVRHVGQPAMDIDLIARDQHGHLFLVQGQQFAAGSRAGSADVQRLIDAVRREEAAGGIFVTTANFTQAAINLAQYSRGPIFLFDGRALSRVPARPSLAWPAA